MKRKNTDDWARQYLGGWMLHQNGGTSVPKKATDGFKAGFNARKNLHNPRRHKFEGSFASEHHLSILDAAEKAYAP
jgi:hypothetical protein